MISVISRLLKRLFADSPRDSASEPVTHEDKPSNALEADHQPELLSGCEQIDSVDKASHVELDSSAIDALVAFDENLLEKSRTQWQFGDWESLSELSREQLQHHPDRAKLALFAAAGRLQIGANNDAHHFIRLARDWGCSPKLISQVLVAGVFNSLGRAATASDKQTKALQYFENAITLGSAGADTKLLIRARVSEQLGQLGFKQNSELYVESCEIVKPAALSDKDSMVNEFKQSIRNEISADLKIINTNPYAHNRTLTPDLNHALRSFAKDKLGTEQLKPAYIDYLATKSIQIEKTCVGRLATTVQDAIARQIVSDCVKGERICVLEIGALYGVGLAIIYNHAVTRFREVQVVCLDPFDGYYGKALDALLNQPVNDLTFVRNMKLSNVPETDFQIIKHYSTTPEAFAKAQAVAFNLLIIDGDHSYEGVKYDFDTFFPLLMDGGYVIFDDYNAKEWPGVQQFIDQDLSRVDNIEYLGFISRTAVGRKLPTSNNH
jgi:cephalosporin hydroxylase